ncbi:MAG: TraB domain-containing protein [Candidatus Thermoplasmatota archaeon]|nr:TraB domain-containing protein [Candidatus Thermoplasmatota archaeon]
MEALLIGVAHVLDIEKRIREILEVEQPEAVAIELDPSRLYALLNPDVRGKGDLMSRVLSGMEKKVADEYGVMPGSEMVAAYEYAREKQLPLYLIDKNFSEIMKGIRSVGLRERGKLLFSGIGSIFIPKRRLDKEMERLMENYDSAMKDFRKSFPKLARVLIDERNEHMISELLKIGINTVAVVGDAHVDGISEGLKANGVEVREVRLRDLT